MVFPFHSKKGEPRKLPNYLNSFDSTTYRKGMGCLLHIEGGTCADIFCRGVT